MSETYDISIKLPPAKWNVVFTALQELPYKIAAPVLNEMTAQAVEAEAQAKLSASEKNDEGFQGENKS